MELINPNYYHPDNDELMSNSQWRHWMDCPARAHAQFVAHTYREPVSRAMAEGALIDALLTDPEHVPAVYREHAEHLTKAATKADLAAGRPERIPNAYAETCVAVAAQIRASRVWSLLEGVPTQQTFVFELNGMAWKCRLDWLDRDRLYIWDGKKTRSCIEEAWCDRLGTRGNFIAQHYYARQLALYREAVRQCEKLVCRVGIVAYTASEPADIRMMPWATEWYHQIDDALADVMGQIGTVDGWRKAHPADLRRCEACEYCWGSRENFAFAYHDPRRVSKLDI
jgi:hypothetical protein